MELLELKFTQHHMAATEKPHQKPGMMPGKSLTMGASAKMAPIFADRRMMEPLELKFTQHHMSATEKPHQKPGMMPGKSLTMGASAKMAPIFADRRS